MTDFAFSQIVRPNSRQIYQGFESLHGTQYGHHLMDL